MKGLWEEYQTTADEQGFSSGSNTSFVKTYVNFIREFFQNTLDQRKKGLEAKVNIKLEDISPDIFPEITKYKKILEQCKGSTKQEPALRFFEKCLELIENKKIPVLKVSESNTSGMIYEEDKEECNWYTFLRSSGLSLKGAGQGGSYGVGKTAIWNLSFFRTIFISSYFNNANDFIFQGKTDFIDYKKAAGERYSGKVYYGENKKRPIKDENEINIFYRRKKEDGTTFFIPFPKFSSDENWQEIFIRVLLNFFWYAIYKKELEVNVEGVCLNSSTLDKYMHDYFSIDDPDDGNIEQDWNPLPYYYAVSKYKENDPNHYFFQKTDFPTLGEGRIYIMTDPKFVSKIVYLRNNHMVIQKLYKGRLSNKPFAAVFITDNQDGSDLLRQMESPEHDKWSEAYAKERYGGELPYKFKKIQKELTGFISDKIKSTSEINSQDIEDIRGMEEFITTDVISGSVEESKETYFQIPIEEEKQEGDEELENKQILTVNSPGEDHKTKTGKLQPKKGGGSGGGGGGGGGRKKRRRVKERANPDGSKEILVPLNIEARTLARYEKGMYEHVMVLKSEVDAVCNFFVHISSDASDDEIPLIKKAFNLNSKVEYKPFGNELKGIKLTSNHPEKIAVIIDDGSEKYRLKIEAYENK